MEYSLNSEICERHRERHDRLMMREFDRKHLEMIENIMNGISFKTDFGSKVVELQCPNCDDTYHIEESKINDGMTDCWRCGALYLQKAHRTSNIRFVRKALHSVKGH